MIFCINKSGQNHQILGIFLIEQENGEKLKIYMTDDNCALPYHFHNGYEIVFTKKEKSNFIINGNHNEYNQNSIIFINQLEKHQMNPHKNYYSRYIAIFDPNFFDKFINDPAFISYF